MKVALSTGIHEVIVQERPAPTAGPGEVIVQMAACGVCGSDVSDDWVAHKLPGVLGHELCGEVVAVGDGAPSPPLGSRVVVHHHAPCGECRRCRRGHETLCEQFRATALDPGGFAEFVRVPAELVGELLDVGALDAERATFVEPLACVLRALRRAGLRGGDSLLVVGAGTSGLLAICAAHSQAVDVVWVSEPRSERLNRALELGAERHGNEPVDIALVCTPNADAIDHAARSLAPGGTLCLYAPPIAGTRLDLDALATFMAEIDVCSSYSAGPRDMHAALGLIASGRIDPLPFVTHRLALADTGLALELARTATALKALVLPC